jgi:hypothetical protein
MSYIVQIKQLSTGTVRIRHETQSWNGEGHAWISGNRACDCNRALLFAQQDECAQAYCGISAYAIQVIDALGSELYREAEFGEPVVPLLTDELLHRAVQQAQTDIAIGSHRAAMRARIGAFARQLLDRLSIQAVRPGSDGLVERHDEG